MPSFNVLMKEAQAVMAGEKFPPVTLPAHYAWAALPSKERQPTQAALDHAIRTLKGEDIPGRIPGQEHRFTASRVGGAHGDGWSCHRAALFAFIGADKIPPTLQEQDNMDIGSACHLAWQVEGLSAGYIVKCEGWKFDPKLRYGSKDDGIQHDGSVLELKFPKGQKFETITRGNRQWGKPPGPETTHVLQMTGVMMLNGTTMGSLVYVNRENGDAVEYRMTLSNGLQDFLLMLLDDLNDWVNLDELPEILEGCQNQTGARYVNCEYREICPVAVNVSGAAKRR